MFFHPQEKGERSSGDEVWAASVCWRGWCRCLWCWKQQRLIVAVSGAESSSGSLSLSVVLKGSSVFLPLSAVLKGSSVLLSVSVALKAAASYCHCLWCWNAAAFHCRCLWQWKQQRLLSVVLSVVLKWLLFTCQAAALTSKWRCSLSHSMSSKAEI